MNEGPPGFLRKLKTLTFAFLTVIWDRDNDDNQEVIICHSGKKEWKRNGVLHRDDGAAVVYESGSEKWYRHGKLHRTDGPAKTTPFHEDNPSLFWGAKKWFIDGKLHRDDGPAIELANGTKKWFQNGQLHRTNGPAIEYANGDKEWWVNGVPHYESGPAIDLVNLKKWYQNGKLHSDDGPAIEHRYGTLPDEISREWYQQGRRHREDGPAVELGAVPEKMMHRMLAVREKIGPNNSHGSFMRFRDYQMHGNEYPRRERYYGDREWWVKGKLHRENAPAIERLDGSKRWYHWGRLHREDGPAVEHPNGSKEWWVKGRLHRINGPAVEVAEGYVLWSICNDKLTPSQKAFYRTFANEWFSSKPKYNPPNESYTGKEWWIKGKHLSEEEFNMQPKRSKIAT